MGARARAPEDVSRATAHSHIETSFAPCGPGVRIVDPVPPLAPSIARLAEAEIRQHGPSSPDAIRPLYIRRPDAELARDKGDLKVGTTPDSGRRRGVVPTFRSAMP